MARQIVIRPPSLNRRQPLLTSQSSTGSVRFGEVAGGTAAECAAVVCCCPCGLLNFVFLLTYKVPAGLCRRALRGRRRRRLIKKGQLQQPPLPPPPRDEWERHAHPLTAIGVAGKSEESEKEAQALEKEMWERFYSSGFWRSPSQREHSINVKQM